MFFQLTLKFRSQIVWLTYVIYTNDITFLKVFTFAILIYYFFNGLSGKCPNHVLTSNGQLKKGKAKYVQENSGEEFSSDFDDDETPFTYVDGIERRDSSVTKKRQFLPEYKKLLVSETCTTTFTSLYNLCYEFVNHI